MGGRLYLDTGDHPEYAGPECLSGHSVALAGRAGDLIVAAALEPIFAMFESRNHNSPKLYKRTLDKNGNSIGVHENYYIRIPGQKIAAYYLLPHLISRTIITGSGYVDNEGDYSLDQRVRVMTNEPYKNKTQNDRPFVVDRDEPFSEDGERLQVLSGSANMLDTPTQFKSDSTNLVIRMIEHKLLPVGFIIERRGDAARAIASQRFGDNFKFDQVVEIGGRRMTAAQIQMYYASTAITMADSGMLNEYDSNFAYRWHDMAVDAIDGKIDRWAHSIDWLAKLALIERYSFRKGGISKAKLKEIDISYHRIPVGPKRPDYKESTVIELLDKRGVIKQLFTEEEIHNAVYQSPDLTRARERGQFIKDQVGNCIKNRYSPRVEWHKWSYISRSNTSNSMSVSIIEHPSPYPRANTAT